MEACVVHRSLALISDLSGDFAEAGSHCEQALAACEPEWRGTWRCWSVLVTASAL